MKAVLDVKLEEIEHKYTDSNDVQYTPVSTVLSAYKEKFDPYKITKSGLPLIKQYVKNHGMTEEYWLNKWDENRDLKATRGTAFHKIKERMANYSRAMYYNNKQFITRDLQTEVAKNPAIDYSMLPVGSYQELTIFHRLLKVAGQADKVIIDVDKYFDIDDYKTNEKFETQSFKHYGKPSKKMYYPLQRLMDCHLYHYTMQLSTYAWMLEQYGLKCRNLRLLHYQITPKVEKELLAGATVTDLVEPTLYSVKYEKALVVRMLNDYRTKVNPLQ